MFDAEFFVMLFALMLVIFVDVAFDIYKIYNVRKNKVSRDKFNDLLILYDVLGQKYLNLLNESAELNLELNRIYHVFSKNNFKKNMHLHEYCLKKRIRKKNGKFLEKKIEEIEKFLNEM